MVRYLEAENSYTQAVMRDTETLQDGLYREMLGRISETSVTPPDRFGDYDYYSRFQQGKPLEILCRKRVAAIAREECILDSNELAKGRRYFRLGRWAVSPNQRLLAYQVETAPAFEASYEISLKDLTTGQTVDRIPNADFSLAWASDNKTLFYVRRDPWRIFRHTLGTGTERDVAVYQESKGGRIMLLLTSSKEYILTCLGSWPFSEVRYLKADRPQDEFRIIQPQQPGVMYHQVLHCGRYFFLLAARSGEEPRLFKTPVKNPGMSHWEEVRFHPTPVLMEGIAILSDYLAILEREGGLPRIHIQGLATSQYRHVNLKGDASVRNGDFDGNVLRFRCTSLVTPATTYDYNMKTRRRQLVGQEAVPGGYDPGQYASERVLATAPDGAKIPVWLVYTRISCGTRRGRSCWRPTVTVG